MIANPRTAVAALLNAATCSSAGASEPAKAAGTEAPMTSGTYFLQESISTDCVVVNAGKFECNGMGTTMAAGKALLVTHINCRAATTGTPSKFVVFIGRGSTPKNAWEFLAYPLAYAYTESGSKYFTTDVTLEYVVPQNTGLTVTGYLFGSGMGSPQVNCTYTGRRATL